MDLYNSSYEKSSFIVVAVMASTGLGLVLISGIWFGVGAQNKSRKVAVKLETTLPCAV